MDVDVDEPARFSSVVGAGGIGMGEVLKSESSPCDGGELRILALLALLTRNRVRGLGSGIRIGNTTRISEEEQAGGDTFERYRLQVHPCSSVLTHRDKDDQGEDREPVDPVIRLSLHDNSMTVTWY